jgi:glycosyltransferase involved in cell wall biosynthesis
MISSPKITVSLSAYNNEKFIGKTIQSILSQTFTDFEFIIVNDGSRDGTLKILQAFAHQDPRIVLINRENKGIVKSKNEILSLTKGEYIANIDGDDIALPDRLRIQSEYLDNHPDVVCVGSDVELIDEKDRFLTVNHYKKGAEISLDIIQGHVQISNPASMVRTSALRQIGGHHEEYTYADDLDVWLRLDEIGKLDNIPIPLTKYRIHSNSASEKFILKQKESAQKACEDAWKRRGIQGKFTSDFKWRADGSRESKLEFTLKYGWLAWRNLQYSTATIYGVKALKISLLSKEAWKLLLCGLLRRKPKQTQVP